MKLARSLKFFIVFLLVLALSHARSTQACAACYGNSDSPLAQGMNWGIFSLLGVVIFVLGSIASFFIFLAWKAAAVIGVDAGPDGLPKKD